MSAKERIVNTRSRFAGLQERFEAKPVGQAAISLLILVFLAVTLIWSMPNSAIQRKLVPVARPIAIGAGWDQNWGVFAPNPPQQLELVNVQVVMADGTIRDWTFPHGDPVIGQYSWYRWQKLKENLIRTPEIRAAFSHWVVDQVAGNQQAVRVQMVVHTEQLIPPGTDVTPAVDRGLLYDEVLVK